MGRWRDACTPAPTRGSIVGRLVDLVAAGDSARARRFWFATLIPLLLLAAALRLSGVAWDAGIGAHPDERHVVAVAEGLAWPDRLNPFALDPAFPYGHLPLYLLTVVGGRDRLMAGRLLAGLADTGTVALAAALGRRMAGRRVGLLGAASLTVMPLHVQQAHFGTADPFAAFFAAGALLFAGRLARHGHRRDALAAGVWVGLAVGCKATAGLLALPMAVGCAAGPGTRRARAARGLALAGAAFVAFAATSPYALLDPRRFAANVSAQAALARGLVLVPYTLQYYGTSPYLYPIAQQLIWGMGPVLGVLCFSGLAAAAWRAVRRPPVAEEWIGLAWALPFFAFIGGLFVKFPRYLLPLTPLLAIYGARVGVGRRPLSRADGGQWTRWILAAGALLTASLVSFALVLSYRQPHPWVAASEYLETRRAPGAVVVVEEWDHPLPLHAAGYDVRALPIFDQETDDKWAHMQAALADADTVVVASRRGYGALAAWPERFPRTAAYYQALFAGERGFATVACFGRWPRVGPLALADDPFAALGLAVPGPGCQPEPPVLWLPRMDESLVVYDRPLVVVLLPVEGAPASQDG